MKKWSGKGGPGWALCWCHTSTPVGNGKLLLVGGWDQSGRLIRSARLLDGNNGLKAVVIEAVQYARASHTATRINLPNGRNEIVLFGGEDDDDECYNDVQVITSAN